MSGARAVALAPPPAVADMRAQEHAIREAIIAKGHKISVAHLLGFTAALVDLAQTLLDDQELAWACDVANRAELLLRNGVDARRRYTEGDWLNLCAPPPQQPQQPQHQQALRDIERQRLALLQRALQLVALASKLMGRLPDAHEAMREAIRLQGDDVRPQTLLNLLSIATLMPSELCSVLHLASEAVATLTDELERLLDPAISGVFISGSVAQRNEYVQRRTLIATLLVTAHLYLAVAAQRRLVKREDDVARHAAASASPINNNSNDADDDDDDGDNDGNGNDDEGGINAQIDGAESGDARQLVAAGAWRRQRGPRRRKCAPAFPLHPGRGYAAHRVTIAFGEAQRLCVQELGDRDALTGRITEAIAEWSVWLAESPTWGSAAERSMSNDRSERWRFQLQRSRQYAAMRPIFLDGEYPALERLYGRYPHTTTIALLLLKPSPPPAPPPPPMAPLKAGEKRHSVRSSARALEQSAYRHLSAFVAPTAAAPQLQRSLSDAGAPSSRGESPIPVLPPLPIAAISTTSAAQRRVSDVARPLAVDVPKHADPPKRPVAEAARQSPSPVLGAAVSATATHVEAPLLTGHHGLPLSRSQTPGAGTSLSADASAASGVGGGGGSGAGSAAALPQQPAERQPLPVRRGPKVLDQAAAAVPCVTVPR